MMNEKKRKKCHTIENTFTTTCTIRYKRQFTHKTAK